VPELAFHVAGLEVLLRGSAAALMGLPPLLHGGAAADPGLVIDLEHEPARDLAPHAADHPRFSRRRDGARLVVERADLAGEIDASSTPVRARFRVAADLYAREACLRVALSVALPCHGAVILHASAVRHRGVAHVFTGVSGAGKSTIATLLDRQPGFDRLTDELVVVARGPWRVHVPALIGDAGLPIGTEAPLASVELLAQAAAHRRARLAPAAAVRELLRHVVVYAAEPATAERVLDIIEQLVIEIPCHRLEFANDPSVAAVVGS
jgi:hypothetical protein